MGRIHNQTIDKVVIYSHGIALDTASSTEQSEEILEEALTWCASTLGLYFRPEMVRRKAYVSQVTFYSDAPLLFVNPVLKELSEEIGKIVSGNLKLESVYEPSGIVLSLDPETQRVPSSPFSIERRQGIAFSEDKYFSVAPLPTDIHLGMLEEYERRIVQQWKK